MRSREAQRIGRVAGPPREAEHDAAPCRLWSGSLRALAAHPRASSDRLALRAGPALLTALVVLGLLAPQAGGGAAAAPATFAVSVIGGYGDGRYAPGSVVHVWSAAATTGEVVLPWSGDDELLDAPAEWRSSFVMPARDVDLVATTEPIDDALTVEQHRGGSNRLKTVRHRLPPDMRGVVLLSHGTGGSSRFIETPEARALTAGLLRAGYGVVSTDAEEVVAGDLDGNGKIRWQTSYSVLNVDLQNLDSLFGDLQRRGLIPPGTPRFALGMSAGGSASHVFGTVSNTGLAPSFPHLHFNAVAAYCADATASRSSVLSTTPSAWYMCGAEDNPGVSNAEARANEATLRARGIPTDHLENPPSPLHGERFARIEGISATTSRAIADELRAAGFVDPDGFLDTDADQITARVVADPAAFPVTSSQTGSLLEIRSQLKTVRAEHSMYADATARTVGFFDRFVDPPSTPFGSWAALVTRVTTDLTGTPPTPSHLDTWVTSLAAGTASRGDLVEELRRSADSTGTVDPVVRLYRAFLRRTPDAEGLRFWVDGRRSGRWTLLRTADHFASSDEFARRYGTLTDRQYASLLYTDVLGRSPDAAGLDFWTRQLVEGRRSRGSVMLGFSESPEHVRIQAEETDVAVAYVFLLGRAPGPEEVADWVGRQEGGESRAALAAELLLSDRYADHALG